MKLTLYPDDYGFVSRDIIVPLEAGLNEITIENIPTNIAPHSLLFSFQKPEQVVVKKYEFVENENHSSISINLILEAVGNDDYLFTFFYKVNQISYQVFYNFLYDNIQNSIAIYGWIEITNYTGIDFNNVILQIVARQNNDNIIFTIDDTHDIENNKNINISFLSKNFINVNHKFIVPFNKDAMIECISIQNNNEAQLGTALIPGAITLYFQDEQQSLQYIGDDSMGICLPDEEILFEIGNADDLIEVTRTMVEDNYITTLQNFSNNAINVNIETNTFGRPIEKSNVVMEIDDRGIAHTELKVIPLTTTQVIYKLTGIEPASIL